MTIRQRLQWKKWVSCLVFGLGAFGLSGCLKPLYMTPETHHLATSVGLPANLATDPNIVATPDASQSKPPATVLDSNREPRPITLPEAISIGLERGNRGGGATGLSNFAGLGGGSGRSSFLIIDDLVQFTGRGVSGDDSIRAFALDPAIVAADIEGAASKFDARLISSMTWQKRDQAVANVFNNFNNGDLAAFSAGLVKPLPTGGVVGITAETNYTKLSAVPAGFAVINPSYTPSLTFNFEQPLLRDYGVDINQLLPSHPGSTQIAGFRPTGNRAEGILVTRMRADQARAEFERELNIMTLNIEFAYWSLYANYFAKYANEQRVRQTYVTWEQIQQLLNAGLEPKQRVAQARAEFERARADHLDTLQRLLESERQLRGLLGMPLEDGTRLVPADSPTLAPFKPDWASALQEALNNRPELAMARQELKIRQLDVMLQQNNLRPDLRFFANYNVNGIGNRLDGPGPVTVLDAQGRDTDLPGNAIANTLDNRFNNWLLGFRLDVPLGNRDAHSTYRVSQLNLARSHVVLKNQERKAELFLGSIYQQLFQAYEQIKIQRARRIALGTQLEGQFDRVKIGKDPLIQLLQAQRDFADAIALEHTAIANYNIALAGFQYAKGTILRYNNITIAEGALPAGVAERAADHFAAKSAGIKLRERPSDVLPQDMDTPASAVNFGASAPLPVLDVVDPSRPAAGPATGGPGGTATPTMPATPGTPGVPGKLPFPMGSPPPAAIPPAKTSGGLPIASVITPDSPTGPGIESAGPGLPSVPVSSFRAQPGR